MRIHAYVLAADPHFLAASLRSYYDRVDRVVVSYDRSSTSWTGTSLPVDECLRIIKAVDVDGKCVLAPGDFWNPDAEPIANDTAQRQTALDQAGDGADWVLQLDTDEIMPAPGTFLAMVDEAEDVGADALEYPARWLYSRVGDAPGGGRYLEASTRFWRPAASFPGPLAVRPGVTLDCARQSSAAVHFRVDLRPWHTDRVQAYERPVHAVIPVSDAVVHYSWVRPDEQMRRKFGWSGHAAAYSQPAVYAKWVARTRRPWRAVLATPVRRHPAWLRLSVIAPEAEDV
ncbi:hypothetical protein GCM10009718_27010 [Isoptericola halotolerans]|uniref:Glycosyl transferase family 2 n=1 Tax=Isoptericola halotolerans TaxID=300560 RepID=A0ABX2A427_9MICO|nr:hypothetical protein [Isoptericola halotolerans]NOV97446.1 hypothetical protein [Isoptericola halotolerans]